jgi:nitrate reductase assembly molybdenum cofactor insertion protein NarJ
MASGCDKFVRMQEGSSIVSEDIGARAFIFDLLSVSFAYPTEELYQSLLDGNYVKELDKQAARLPQLDRLVGIVRELAVYRDNHHADDYNDFQSEYIRLFEYNNETTPLHLNAHLYSDGEPQPVPVYQRLKATYSEFDIEMASEKGIEQPDHLSVQLEFFAHLHRLLLEADDEQGRQKIKGAIEGFCVELGWTRRWMEHLQTRPVHTFYHPLAQFLLVMIEIACDSAAISE